MNQVKFTITGRLAGLNQLFNSANANRYVGAGIKKKETHRCAMAIFEHRLPKISQAIKIHFSWHEPNARRDIDNISTGAKFILDALVETGTIPNDGRKWVKGISHVFPDPDPVSPRIEVTITEWSEGL